VNVKGWVVTAVVAIALAWGGYSFLPRLFYRGPDVSEKRIGSLQKEIDGLTEEKAAAEIELKTAKENAARALEKARLAQARAEVFASQAAEWRQRYNLIAAERDTLKRAQTGSEAVKELRRMGWVR